MTAPVDVLAVLDCAAHCVTEHRGAVRGREVMQARAAVAELISQATIFLNNEKAGRVKAIHRANLAAALRAVGGRHAMG